MYLTVQIFIDLKAELKGNQLPSQHFVH